MLDYGVVLDDYYAIDPVLDSINYDVRCLATFMAVIYSPLVLWVFLQLVFGRCTHSLRILSACTAAMSLSILAPFAVGWVLRSPAPLKVFSYNSLEFLTQFLLLYLPFSLPTAEESPAESKNKLQ